jgi:hypothetical protein
MKIATAVAAAASRRATRRTRMSDPKRIAASVQARNGS